jgi:hypothetical protein
VQFDGRYHRSEDHGRKRGEVGLLSWGRLFDPVDPSQLIARLREVLPLMGLKDVLEISVCHDLGELCDYRYFYEGSFNSLLSRRKDNLLMKSRPLIRKSPMMH